jgi:hypothetical protein
LGATVNSFGIGQSGLLATSGLQQVSWGDVDLSRLQGQAIRLRFEFRNAALYSFQFT